MRLFKKPFVTITTSLFILFALYLFFFLNSSDLQDPKPLNPDINNGKNKFNEEDIIHSKANPVVDVAFMPKMGNETLKAELGNASWKLFHTILARYPEVPTSSERSTLEQYIELFAKVYPCGDCARHFQKLLEQFPPQLSNRQIASVWGCHVHNQVNKRLLKPEYDCSNILEDYDCGCGNDEQTLGDNDDNDEPQHFKFDVQKEGKQLG